MSNSHSHHSSEHQHKEYPGQAIIVIGILVVALLFGIYFGGQPVYSAIKQVLQLDRSDLFMIPVSSLAFIIFWRLLDGSLFRPLLKVIEQREILTTGAAGVADSASKEADEIDAKCEELVSDARLIGMRAKLSKINEAKQVARGISDQASVNAAQTIESERKKVSEDVRELRDRIKTDVDALAEQVAGKVLDLPATAGKI